MNSKTINHIVWWIPFYKLRNSVRAYLRLKYCVFTPCIDSWFIKSFRKSIKEDADFLSKYINLIKNLDYDSMKVINNIISKLCNYNDIEDETYFDLCETKEINETIMKHLKKSKKIDKYNYSYGKYILPSNSFEPEAFYGKCGMDYIENLNKIKNKSIIDAGAFIGDTAIILSDYTDKNVYSFEPFLQNYNLMLKTIELNKKNNIIPVNMALGNENKEIGMDASVGAGSGLSIENAKESNINNIKNKVKMMTLDSYVKENNIEVGLIKTDLEGFEQPFLKGAIETIKEQKPVLIISIYHNYSDFFEIKPMIENLNLGYKFRIIRNKSPQLITETKLLAEVY